MEIMDKFVELPHYLPNSNCRNNQQEGERMIEEVRLEDGRSCKIDLSHTMILFLLGGELSLSFEKIGSQKLAESHMALFVPGGGVTLKAVGDSWAVIFKMEHLSRLCEQYSLESLYEDTGESCIYAPYPLLIKERLKTFVESLAPYTEDQFHCRSFAENKGRELQFLLRYYYSREELCGFFSALITPDVKFSNFVWENYRKARSVENFADISNYSLSMFKQKFKEVFGVPALKWMNEQRARNVFYDLRYTDKTLEQIAEEHHFSSNSYLSTFCTKHLSQTPTEIRRKVVPSSTLG